MSKMESSSSNETRKRTGTIAFVLAFSVVALAASGAAYGARQARPGHHRQGVPKHLRDVDVRTTCTIPEGSNGVCDFRFQDHQSRSTLNVKGSLTINAGVTISNAGMIIVENVAGVTPASFSTLA